MASSNPVPEITIPTVEYNAMQRKIQQYEQLLQQSLERGAFLEKRVKFLETQVQYFTKLFGYFNELISNCGDCASKYLQDRFNNLRTCSQ